MSLLPKSATPRLRAARQANSLKSTGPRTAPGKLRSSRNAMKFGLFSKLPLASMKELGEDPADFERLYQSLRRAFGPRDGFEEMLIEDMAEIRWRRQRVMRAEAGILAWQKRKFEIDRQLNVEGYGKGLSGVSNDMTAAEFGLAGQNPSPANFKEIIRILRMLSSGIKFEGFKEEDSHLLSLVYGKNAPFESRVLIKWFKTGCEEAKPESGKRPEKLEMTRRSFLDSLEKEIASFEKLRQLHSARDVEVTEPLSDSHLIPPQEDLDKILRCEGALERQFERKVQQLVAWRRANVRALPPDTSEGEQTPFDK
jgi:hypothetical protein